MYDQTNRINSNRLTSVLGFERFRYYYGIMKGNIITTVLGLAVGIWMGLVLYIGFNMLNKLDYIAETGDYEIQMLDLIWGELEPIGHLGIISQGRSFSCTVDSGLTDTYN